MTSSTKFTGLAMAMIMLLVPSVAVAHDEKDPRHQAMTALGQSMKAISETLKSGQPIDAETQSHAQTIVEVGDRMLRLFPQGSGGHHSRAKPEIWSDWSGFTAKADAFETAGGDLAKAVADGDRDQVASALKAGGATCGGCHKPYRKPKAH